MPTTLHSDRGKERNGSRAQKVGGAPEGEETSVLGTTNQEQERRRDRDRSKGSLERYRVVIPPTVQNFGNLDLVWHSRSLV